MSDGSVVITGATGLVGTRLTAALVADGRSVRAVTRSPDSLAGRLGPEVEPLAWDGVRLRPEDLDGTAALVHLAGEPIFGGPLLGDRRRRAWDSRVESTRALVEALGALAPERRPAVFACASAVGIYGDRGDERLEEESAPGAGFLADLCRAWEEAAAGAEALGVRRVSLRLGVVLAREGGALPTMARPFRLGLGARLGDGSQWFPWVHIDDTAQLVRWALDRDAVAGPVNVVAPGCVTNAELTRCLARTLGRPGFLRVPAALIRLGLGELAGELLGSRRVVPAVAEAGAFPFAHPTLEGALEAELG